MKIQFELDADGPLEPEALLGNVAIQGSDGQSIHVDSTYIDSWLDALVRILSEVQQNRDAAADLVDEPDPLRLAVDEAGGAILSHKEVAVQLKSSEELRLAIVVAIRELMRHLEPSARNATPLLRSLGGFLAEYDAHRT